MVKGATSRFGKSDRDNVVERVDRLGGLLHEYRLAA
jgi:hypothetical protein